MALEEYITKLALIIALIAISVVGNAQDLDTNNIVWRAASKIEWPENTVKVNSGTIVTYRMDRVEIKDADGGIVARYTLSNPIGDLQNASQDGTIRFRAKSAGTEPFIFSIDKRGPIIEITLSFPSMDSKPREDHYEIVSTSIL
ncbi:MAG: hypothetical protein WDN75_09530 [Bacteroidota bacterium]